MEGKLFNDFKTYAIGCHAATNHQYDCHPYSYHLSSVISFALQFIELIPLEQRDNVLCACAGHDLIEDARETYNDVKKRSNLHVAEIIRACTNLTRGRNRKERMPELIYEEIKSTPGALFVKLCDRMANAKYSKERGGSQFDMYRREHSHFKGMLYEDAIYEPMWEHLETLLDLNKI